MILDALEKLLRDTALRDLGVEEIAQSAHITRTRFYHYYKSKYEAYAALLRRVAAEAINLSDLPGAWFDRPESVSPRESLFATMRGMKNVWFEHQAVLREASDLWNAVPEVREGWFEIINGLIDRTRTAIELERERGVAPPGPDAQRLAESLIWHGERTQFLIFINAPGALAPDDLVDMTSWIWLRTIYLSDDPKL
ncbi:TetR/AcrR family transcriptional regulator [Nocardia sp. SC052]|uniref:TetR/AcrR family transcriptional regulator n=1 Tax=Nocardia sichangensis TaxID=3385975 RepID=UPI0039A13CF8